jgi:hypothetical protein
MDWTLTINLLVTVFTIAGVIYGFFRNFKVHMKEEFKKIDSKFDKIDSRFDKMDEKLTDIDRRLCRLEGAFYSKECCMFKHDDKRKVE